MRLIEETDKYVIEAIELEDWKDANFSSRYRSTLLNKLELLNINGVIEIAGKRKDDTENGKNYVLRLYKEDFDEIIEYLNGCFDSWRHKYVQLFSKEITKAIDSVSTDADKINLLEKRIEINLKRFNQISEKIDPSYKYSIRGLLSPVQTLEEDTFIYDRAIEKLALKWVERPLKDMVYKLANSNNELKFLNGKDITLWRKTEDAIRVTRKATEEDKQRLFERYDKNIEVGSEISEIPLPQSEEEIHYRFYSINCLMALESYIDIFIRKFGKNPTKKVLEDQLNNLETFIDEANELSTIDTFKKNTWIGTGKKREMILYSRLKNGYYDNLTINGRSMDPYLFYDVNADLVYGKYELFKDWLTEQLDKLNTGTIATESHNMVSNRNKEDNKYETLVYVQFFLLKVHLSNGGITNTKKCHDAFFKKAKFTYSQKSFYNRIRASKYQIFFKKDSNVYLVVSQWKNRSSIESLAKECKDQIVVNFIQNLKTWKSKT